MIKKASLLTRAERRKKQNITHGVYFDDSDDLFDIYLVRYPTGVLTLCSALSFYGLIDYWIEAPFYFNFQIGYRTINDFNIKMFRDDKELQLMGVVKEKHNKIEFSIYNKERLLIELFRKERYVPLDIYKQAIFAYRNLANKGELNIPLIREYLSKVPKSKIYEEKLSREVL